MQCKLKATIVYIKIHRF